MRSRSHPREWGFTIVELMFGLLVFVIGAVVLVNHLSINFQTTASQRDRVFAYNRAQTILSEIQAFVDRGDADAAVDLFDRIGFQHTRTRPAPGKELLEFYLDLYRQPKLDSET